MDNADDIDYIVLDNLLKTKADNLNTLFGDYDLLLNEIIDIEE